MHTVPARPYAIFCTAALPWLTRLSLAILAAVLVSGCASTSLQEWHTTRLKSEFSTKDIDTITSFADYQHMEDLLFEELKQVYLPNTPDNVTLRYSEGSAADPTVRTPNWNRSFILPAQNAIGAALLLHGMSDSPYSLRQLALALNEKGYTVLGLRMPGHGTAPSGMVYVHWQDMAAAVNLGMSHLNQLQPGQPIHIVG